MKNNIAYAITLTYENEKEEILLGLIYEFKQDVVDYYKSTLSHSPLYKIRKIKISIIT